MAAGGSIMGGGLAQKDAVLGGLLLTRGMADCAAAGYGVEGDQGQQTGESASERPDGKTDPLCILASVGGAPITGDLTGGAPTDPLGILASARFAPSMGEFSGDAPTEWKVGGWCCSMGT